MTREFQSWEAGVALRLWPCFLVPGVGVLEEGHEDDMVGRELGWEHSGLCDVIGEGKGV